MNYLSTLSGVFTNFVHVMTGSNLQPVNDEEKELAEKIINSFQEQIKPQFQHDTINPRVEPKKFYVCFKQSESWSKFKKELEDLSTLNLDETDKQMLHFWKSLISSITQLHQDIASDKPHEIRMAAQEHLRILYRDAKIQIQNNYTHYLTNRQNKNIKLVEFIDNFGKVWQLLWAFREWPEIPLDSSKIYVKVLSLKQEPLDIEECVDYSNKCIVGLKEGDFYCKPKEVNGQYFKMCLPEKLEIVRECYGPPSDYTIESERLADQPREKTAQAEKLYRITLIALEQVNQDLTSKIQKDNMERYRPLF